MLKKICVIGSSGYIGSNLISYLEFKKIKVTSDTVPRPKNENNIEKFYKNYIFRLLKKNPTINLFINCAGSISCKSYKDFYFNSHFDIIFQNILNKKKKKISYINLNSTKVFTNNLDNYAVSKKLLHESFICSKYFKSIYIDLIFDQNSQTFLKIYKIIKKTLLIPIPIFYPGKIFYPVNCNKLVKIIYEIITSKKNFERYLVIGTRKFYFYELILQVIKTTKLNKKLIFIKSSFISKLPKVLVNLMLKSKFFQLYDCTDFLKKENLKNFKIVRINYSI